LQAIGFGTTVLTANFSGLTTNVTVEVGQHLRFTGLTPLATATIEVTTNLTPPVVWQTVGTATVGADGTLVFVDTTDRGPQAFYRAFVP
jgi:hypothetical protein